MDATIKEWLQKTENFISVNDLWIWTLLSLLLFVSMVVSMIALRYAKGMKLRWQQSLLLAQKLQAENGLEQNLSDMLDLVAQWVDAPTYVFYLYDENKRVYLLKAVRHRSRNFGRVEPSYSGLVEYKKEQYLPQLSLAEDAFSDRIKTEKAGEVKLLTVPIGDRQGIIRVGPMMKGKLDKRTKRILQDFTGMMNHALRQFIGMENIRNKANIIVSTGEALKRINSIAMDSKVTIDFVLKLAVKVMNADGAFFCTRQGEGYQLSAISGTDPLVLQGFEQGETVQDVFAMSSEEEDIRFITQSDDSFYQIPPYVAAIGAEAYTVVDVSERREERRSRMLVLWYMTQTERCLWTEMRESLHILADNMREILGCQTTLKRFSGTYVHILKTLALLQDSLNPYTVGYSELMSRYSIVIAKELGLEEDIIKDVALAAYLSNIGVLSISADLVNKEGKFSDEEFELIKLHSEVGASIVQSTLGNERVASYIMHHHERMDGNGYPAGLRGEEIPIGARIIGVVQTFLAIVNGRKYRDPLPFNNALQTLSAASGSQLDGNIVQTFATWFKNKQADPKLNGRSLGVCWEMCCTPSSICENCPAYRRTDINCWEVEGNNCKAHGKKCQTCYVRTEATTRKELMYK